MIKRILVPLDGSARAEYALPIVARIVRAWGCSIHLLEVVAPPIDYGGGFAVAPLIAEQLIEAETTEAIDYLQTMAASPRLAGIQTTTEVVFGIPAQYILAEARRAREGRSHRFVQPRQDRLRSLGAGQCRTYSGPREPCAHPHPAGERT
jgi:nucleotide-binding universal stress UspA family protein